VEVSNLNGFVTVQQGQNQPIIGTRTISSNIRLKDGETNFLAGLLRNDKSHGNDTIPFMGDVPILGRLFSRKSTTNKTSDLVLTLTPHIIRIPDVTEEDLTPVYVGTDANISFQGTPRIESPAGGGPFDLGTRQPPVPRPTPPPANTPAPFNLVPGGMPSDPFRPTPPPRPTPSGIRPGTSAISESPGNLIFDFDPLTISLAPGQQKSILVRAGGDQSVSDVSLSIRFDPAVAAAVAVRPILIDGGMADARIESGHIIIEIPSGMTVSGTRAIAEILLQGIAPGNASLFFEKAPSGSSLSQATVEVR
jgi:general secretion pathway protein D